MTNCSACGRPLRDDARFCPGCGAEVATPPVTPSPSTSGQSATIEPKPRRTPPPPKRRLAWIAAGALVLGGSAAAAILLTRGPAPSQNQAVPAAPTTGNTSAARATPATPTPSPTSGRQGATPASPSTAPPAASPAPKSSDPADVVSAYYAAVGTHAWSTAWQLGGRNFGQSYGDFVKGYTTTVRDIVTLTDTADTGPGAGQVSARLLAFTTDGVVRLFTGAYTVSGGAITGANISLQTSQPATTFDQAGAAAQLADLGYDLNQGSPPITGSGLVAVTGTCHGSADGHCQKVFFYEGGRLVAVDTPTADLDVSVAWQNADTAALVYPQYRSGDPMCCPSGNRPTVLFRWNGTAVAPTTPLPDPVNGQQ